MKSLILCLLIGSIAAKDQLCSDCPGCLSPQGKCVKYNPEMAKEDSKGNSMTRKQFSEKCIKKGGIDCSETNLECKLSEDCPISKPYCRQSLCYECIGDGDCSYQKPHCFANNCKECVDDSHCPSSLPFCDIVDNTCKVVHTCQTDSQCPELLPICDAGDRQCKECTTDSHCTSSSKGTWCNSNVCQCRNDDECNYPYGYCEGKKNNPYKKDLSCVTMSGYRYITDEVCDERVIAAYSTLEQASSACNSKPQCGCIYKGEAKEHQDGNFWLTEGWETTPNHVGYVAWLKPFIEPTYNNTYTTI